MGCFTWVAHTDVTSCYTALMFSSIWWSVIWSELCDNIRCPIDGVSRCPVWQPWDWQIHRVCLSDSEKIQAIIRLKRIHEFETTLYIPSYPICLPSVIPKLPFVHMVLLCISYWPYCTQVVTSSCGRSTQTQAEYWWSLDGGRMFCDKCLECGLWYWWSHGHRGSVGWLWQCPLLWLMPSETVELLGT